MNKEEIQKIIKTPGKVRGAVFQTDAAYVLNKRGREGLLKVQKELEKIGCPIDYENIKTMDWYPLGLRAISLLTIKKTFNWQDSEIEEMGNAAPKYSLIVKLLLRYFLTFEKTYKESPKYWEKHYTVGELGTPDYSLKKKYSVIQIKNFKIHPILCVYLKGYFMRICQLMLKEGKNFKVEETKCMFRNDPYHEIIIRWE